MKSFERIQPTSWEDAAAALDAAKKAGVSAEPKGAGTDLLDRMKERSVAPDRIVDLRRLPGNGAIEKSPSQIVIGSLVTLTRVVEGLHAELPALADACEGAATPQIRNAATLAGNLCQRPRCWYFRSADFACLKKGGSECFAQKGENVFHAVFGNHNCAIVHPSAAGVALAAYGARVDTLSARGRRTIPIADFFVTPEVNLASENSLAEGELVTRIVVPRPAGLKSAYRKVKHKQTFDWPLADAAVSYRDDGGVARDVRIVLGSAAPVPWRLKKAEALVEGQRIDAALAARAGTVAIEGATPLAKNGYKLQLVTAVVRRALLGAAGLPDGTEKAPQA
jgi:xanthine dehydrogenase YagS FAD-binding subunit